jgi:3-isopropylmalate dehydrogenase
MKVACLPGDGIGPEVYEEAARALRALLPELELEELPIGGAAIRAVGDPLPEETLGACREADAVLKGPIGEAELEPGRVEEAFLRLRKELDVYGNLRPARTMDAANGVDLLIVRELVGGLYFGAKGVREDGTVYDTCEYHPREVERVARLAFELAQARRGTLTSIDKANVLETSRMWRRVVDDVAGDYSEVNVEHMLADNAAMQLVRAPEQFDVIVTENTFGDILSDVAAEVTGGLGLAPSASLSDGGPGLFEPVHGSAPDIAGKGIANPTAMLRSAALMLELGLGQPEAAHRLHDAVDVAVRQAPTPDLGGRATTREFGEAVLGALAEPSQVPSESS